MTEAGLRLRPLRRQDEEEARAAHDALRADDFPFLLDYDPSEPWDTYLERLDDERRGIRLVVGRVPATFLVAVVGVDIVGRLSLRHQLTEYLATIGGHIGYAVVPRFRGRGYATEMLRQGLVVARAAGIDRVLVTCDEGNVGSAKAIERCGGAFEGLVDQTDGLPRKRRYWIG